MPGMIGVFTTYADAVAIRVILSQGFRVMFTMTGKGDRIVDTTPAQRASPAGEAAARLHVMIADADPQQREHLARAVRAAAPHAHISFAAKGDEAAAAIVRLRPDVLFINVKLPEMSGAEAVVMARHEKVTPITILLSDNILSRWVALATELDAYEFLKHPYDPNHIAGLLEAIERMRTKMRVLLVESSEPIRALMHKLLRQSRFDLHLDDTDSGIHALKLIGNAGYDVALIDLHLAGMDGLETACKLKDQSPDTRLVLMSAPGSEKIEAASGHFGFNSFLQKPFYAHHIEDVLHEIFKLRRPYLLNAIGRVHVRRQKQEEERRARKR